jgi:hypothetical protein
MRCTNTASASRKTLVIGKDDMHHHDLQEGDGRRSRVPAPGAAGFVER